MKIIAYVIALLLGTCGPIRADMVGFAEMIAPTGTASFYDMWASDTNGDTSVQTGQLVIPFTTSLSALTCGCTLAPGAGSWVAEVFKGSALGTAGTLQLLTCPITDPNTTCQGDQTGANFTAGDILAMRLRSSGATTTTSKCHCGVATSGNSQVLSFTNFHTNQGVPGTNNLSAFTTAITSRAGIRVPYALTAKNLYCFATAAPTTGTLTVDLQKSTDGVTYATTGVTCSIPAGQPANCTDLFNTTGHSGSFSIGDSYAFALTGPITGTPQIACSAEGS